MEKMEEVFAEYNFEKKRVFRGRKLLMCEDSDGKIYGITETASSENRLRKEFLVKQYLKEHNFPYIDQLLLNRKNQFITEDRYHTPFVIKEYFTGRECDVNNGEEIKKGAKNLARFHRNSKGAKAFVVQREAEYYRALEQQKEQAEKWVEEEEPAFIITSYERDEAKKNTDELSEKYENSSEGKPEKEWEDGISYIMKLYEKRNRELKRIAAFMCKPGRKGEFVSEYNRCAGQFYTEAIQAKNMAEKAFSLQEKPFHMGYGLCHGSYQHHNILKCGEIWATVAMEQFYFGIQLLDLYDFLRKVLEKNDYRIDFAQAVLEGYQEEIRLRREDYLFLYFLLLYPEKFWKISNHYYNSRKTWMPPKTIEKLNNVVRQNKEKKEFLYEFKNSYLE